MQGVLGRRVSGRRSLSLRAGLKGLARQGQGSGSPQRGTRHAVVVNGTDSEKSVK